MNAKGPGVAVGFDHFRLADHVVVRAVFHIALADEGFRLLHDASDVDQLEQLPPLERIRRIFWYST